MKIIDNFLSIKEQNLIEGVLLGREFAWHFKPITTDESDFVSVKTNKHNLKIKDTNLFYHIFYDGDNISSNFYHHIIKVLDKSQIKYKKLVRIKANYYSKSNFKSDEIHPPHIDGISDNCFSFIYFVNDSDGDFRIFDDNLKVVKKITPKKGQAVLFNSNKYHSGSSPVKSNNRININFVFEM